MTTLTVSTKSAFVFLSFLSTRAHLFLLFQAPWIGLPRTLPSFVLDNSTSPPSFGFISWNGATEVASYRLVLGASPSSLYALPVHLPRTGFETRLELPWQRETTDEGVEKVAIASFVAVVAYDAAGRVLGASEVLETMTGEGTGLLPDVEAIWWQDQRRKIQLAGIAVVRFPLPFLSSSPLHRLCLTY